MKVLFSNPPWWHLDKARSQLLIGDRFALIGAHMRRAEAGPRTIRAGFESTYPEVLGSAASLVKDSTRCEVRFRDSICIREDYQDYLGAVIREQPGILFTASCTRSLRHDLSVILELKRLAPGLSVCVCLVRPDEEAARACIAAGIDSVVAGNFERACLAVCGGARGIVPNESAHSGAAVGSYPYLDDALGRLYFQVDPVFPASELDVKPFPQLTVHTARRDAGAGGPSESQVHRYEPSRITGWIHDCRERFGSSSLHVADGVLGRDPDRSQAVFEALSDCALPWSFSTNPGACAQETFVTARDCGCYGVSFIMGRDAASAAALSEGHTSQVVDEIEETRGRALTASLTIDSSLLAGPNPALPAELSAVGSTLTRVTL